MADESSRKPVKVGVQVGGGPPPGYQWNVDVLDLAFEEAMSFLKPDQYSHMVRQVKELARQADPTHSQVVNIESIETYYEIKDRGGVLHPLNVRVFYGVDKSRRTIVVLGAIHKQNNGPTPAGDRIRMRRRLRLYLEQIGSGD